MFTGLVAGRGFVHDVRPEGVDDSSAQRAESAADNALGGPRNDDSSAQRAESAADNALGGPRNDGFANAAALRLTIRVPDGFGPAGSLGESVAINGCCLTAVVLNGNRWSFQAGSETLSKTNLGQLRAGDAVNLERALAVDGRLGGHFVQGHVDGVGQVDRIERAGEWVTMWFRAPEPLLRQVVPKGSVAVDGVSLTVVECLVDRFSVALIPHTLEQTTLGLRKPGDKVNIETDILGKYVQQMLRT